MNDDAISTTHALAIVIARCRPEGATRWDLPGIEAKLLQLGHLPLADVAHAAIRAAENPAIETPGVIPRTDGAHWREPTTTAPLRQPPPWCGQCSPKRRIEDDQGRDRGPCPRCHPSAAGTA